MQDSGQILYQLIPDISAKVHLKGKRKGTFTLQDTPGFPRNDLINGPSL
jgi:hypothetical protein